MEFEFERRRITKEDVRELIYREILEYHPKMLKEFLEEAEPTENPLELKKRQTTRKKVSKLGNLSLQKRILVVDANAANRKVAEGVLQKYGATVTYVEGGRAAL